MALLDTQVGVLANQAMNYLVSGKAPRRLGNAHPNIVPYQVVPGQPTATSSSRSAMTASSASSARVLGRPELADDPRFATNRARVEQPRRARRR